MSLRQQMALRLFVPQMFGLYDWKTGEKRPFPPSFSALH
jgi:hypothetical protein